jgi:hypothetical protein
MKLTLQDLPTTTASMVLRPLGTFEEFFWLIDQNRPVHFALAARVQGPTTVGRWRGALDLVQRRHPFFSVCIEKNGKSAPHFRQEKAAPIPLRVVQGNNAVQRWESEMERELSIPFNARQAPLVRARCCFTRRIERSVSLWPTTPLQMDSPLLLRFAICYKHFPGTRSLYCP